MGHNRGIFGALLKSIIGSGLLLNTTSKVLHSPSRQPLDTLGSLTVLFSDKGKSTTTEVFVIPKLIHNLLGHFQQSQP